MKTKLTRELIYLAMACGVTTAAGLAAYIKGQRCSA